jgi:uncharacterized membrane protein YuzA (DUF378 family)
LGLSTKNDGAPHATLEHCHPSLVIIGGLNWGLVAIGGYDADLVAGLFGGEDSALARIVYGLIGLWALYQIVPFARSLKRGQVDAKAGRHTPDPRDPLSVRQFLNGRPGAHAPGLSRRRPRVRIRRRLKRGSGGVAVWSAGRISGRGR